MQWRKALSDMDEQTVSYVASCFQAKTGYSLAEAGIQKLRRSLHAFSLSEVLDAIDVCASSYGKYDTRGLMTQESANEVFRMIQPVCRHKRDGDIELGTDSIYYSAGILHNRFSFPKKQFLPRLRQAEACGIDAKKLKEIALTAKNYQTWRIQMEELIAAHAV